MGRFESYEISISHSEAGDNKTPEHGVFFLVPGLFSSFWSLSLPCCLCNGAGGGLGHSRGGLHGGGEVRLFGEGGGGGLAQCQHLGQLLLHLGVDRVVHSQHIGVELLHLFAGGEGCNVHLVAHGTGQSLGDAVNHPHILLVLLHDLLMAVHKVLAIAAACKGAVVVLAHRHIRAAEGDHICPDLVHVGGTGKVDWNG